MKAYWLKAYSKDAKDPNKPAVAPFLIQCYNICLVFYYERIINKKRILTHAVHSAAERQL